MKETALKILASVAGAILLVIMGWFASHALEADQYSTTEEVREELKDYVPRETYQLQIDQLEEQYDQIDQKLNMLIGVALDGND